VGQQIVGEAGPIRILIVEYVATDANLIEQALRQVNLAFVSKRVDTRSTFVEALETFKPEVLLSDALSDFSCREIIDHVRRTHPEVPVVIVTDLLGVAAAIELLKAGARDYVPKTDLWRLPLAVERAISVEQGIRARKAAEKAVQASELQYRRLFEAAKDGILILDADTAEIADVNPFLIHLLGYSREEYQGKKLWEIAPFREIAKSKANFVALQQTEYVSYDDLPLETKDGLKKDVEFISSRYMAGDRKVIQCNIRDITERKRAEAQIREDEAKFRAVVEQNVAGVMMIRQDATIAYINPYWARLNGYDADETLGHSIFEYIPAAEQPRVREELTKQFSGGGFVQLATSMLAKDGHVVDILVNASAGIYEEQAVSIAVLLDITERKRAEERLEESEERFRLLVEEAPDAILLYDFDQNRFIGANKAAERLFGTGRDEILGHGPQHFYAPAQPDGVPTEQSLDRHNQQVLAGQEVTFERRIVTAAGEERLCQVTLVRLSAATARLMRASFVDVTAQQQAELAMQRLNRTLRTLSRGNEVVVRATDEAELLREMCQTIVETGGYRMAWVGMVDHDAGKSVRPVASAGETGDYLERARVTWAEEARGQGPIGVAIRSGEPQNVQNLIADPRMAPWRASAERLGFAAAAAFPLADRGGVFAALAIYAGETHAFDAGALNLLQELADDLAYGIQALRDRANGEAAERRWRAGLEATIGALASAAEMRDPYTAGHQQRVARLAVAIARELQLPEQQIEGLYLAGIVHDVGKINVPAEILSNPGRLSEAQYQLVREHAEAGYAILKGVDFPWPLAEIVRQHHERLDGSGYPRGLKGDEILPEAQILSVADVVESMLTHRPYRPARGRDAALAEIEKGKGAMFDPAAVDACLALFRENGFRFE
jgi:PAS domain S-box-containing protein/putative nucleotidyltransferase with HDIG domain